jgi:hypothetical protein
MIYMETTKTTEPKWYTSWEVVDELRNIAFELTETLRDSDDAGAFDGTLADFLKKHDIISSNSEILEPYMENEVLIRWYFDNVSIEIEVETPEGTRSDYFADRYL